MTPPEYTGRDGIPDLRDRLWASEQKDVEHDGRLDVIETPPADILDYIALLDQGITS